MKAALSRGGATVRGAIAGAVTVLAIALLLILSRQDPISAMRALVLGGFGSRDAWLGTLADATPLLLTGTAVWVALSAGWLNLGAEGQLSVGALCSVMVALAIPGPVGLLAGLCAAFVVGAIWSLPSPFLRARVGAHEVVTGLLLNFLARNITRWLAAGPWRDPAGDAPRTAEAPFCLPILMDGSELHGGFVIAIMVSGGALLAAMRSVLGYEARFCGSAPEAARRAGIPVERRRFCGFALSGGLCGLAGAVVVLGATPFRGYPADFHGIGHGFDGLVAALLAGPSPWGIPLAALMLGGLGNGADAMAFDTGTPKQISQVAIACVFLAIAVGGSRKGRPG